MDAKDLNQIICKGKYKLLSTESFLRLQMIGFF